MTTTVVLTCLLIILARIADVSLGTLRMVSVIRGRRTLAVILGFFEVLIWVMVVSAVVAEVRNNPLYALCYATGFALGNFVGLTIERAIASGEQVVRVFTRRAQDMVPALRERGYRITTFDGHGRDGPVSMLFMEAKRREIPTLLKRAREFDPACFLIVDDIRLAWRAQAVGGDGENTGPHAAALKK